ncbi:hypothetical protein EDB80DRAFT_433796 [Ilyonectria destructans]|nr:hypothetical protein EDB80DRAFT_433796 [Ilyonectria destructans]
MNGAFFSLLSLFARVFDKGRRSTLFPLSQDEPLLFFPASRCRRSRWTDGGKKSNDCRRKKLLKDWMKREREGRCCRKDGGARTRTCHCSALSCEAFHPADYRRAKGKASKGGVPIGWHVSRHGGRRWHGIKLATVSRGLSLRPAIRRRMDRTLPKCHGWGLQIDGSRLVFYPSKGRNVCHGWARIRPGGITTSYMHWQMWLVVHPIGRDGDTLLQLIQLIYLIYCGPHLATR